ncbi:MAG: NAD-dependent epimerase/dehydratase family protein [Planctomycetota bacterium]|nr:NAD-dependent epimerase/dehydratase family protein [Planctomycetota bacterium]
MFRDTKVKKALIIGCGYLGQRVALRLQALGLEVLGTTRSESRARELQEAGIPSAVFELESAADHPLLEQGWDTAVYAAAAGKDGDAELVFRDAPLACHGLLGGEVERFVQVSSTGVYPQTAGEELDEESPERPAGGRPALVREAERRLLATRAGNALVIRLGGLYGPGRSPLDWLRRPGFRERLRGGAEAWMNWIHIEDAAAAVCAAAAGGRAGEIYLAVDGNPVRRRDFYQLAAELAGVEPPELDPDSADLGKRLSNHKLIEELGVDLLYPDYRSGLEAISQAP